MVKADVEKDEKKKPFKHIRNKWKKGTNYFEHGRICCINYGPDAGKLCCIVNFIDSTKALVDGPEKVTNVKRQSIPFRRLSLTPLKINILPDAKSRMLEKVYEKDKIIKKWEKLPWAKKLARAEKRANLSDFDRFKVMVLKKKRRDLINKEVQKLKKKAFCQIKYHSRVPAMKSKFQLILEAKARGDKVIPKPSKRWQKQCVRLKKLREMGVLKNKRGRRPRKAPKHKNSKAKSYEFIGKQQELRKKRRQSAKKLTAEQRKALYKPLRKKKEKRPRDPKKRAEFMENKKRRKQAERIKRRKYRREKKKARRTAIREYREKVRKRREARDKHQKAQDKVA